MCRWDAFFAACKDCRVDFMVTSMYTCDMDGTLAYLKQLGK